MLVSSLLALFSLPGSAMTQDAGVVVRETGQLGGGWVAWWSRE